MTPAPLFRPVLDTLPAYRPGRAVAGPDGRSYKLSSNESPFGPLPSVAEAIARAARQANLYPDNGSARLAAAIAARHGVPVGHVAVGCGSVGLLQQLLAATCDPGSEVVYAWRSFEAYPILTGLAGALAVQVPLRDQTHDLPAMLAAVTPATALILVCNPNNPTGTALPRRELADFLDAVPADCLVVLDEAYREYVTDADVPDGLDLYRNRPNVAVLRTFSKAYGLAALRVGFLVGHPPVAEAVRRTMLPFTVNHLAQAAAESALAARAELAERVGGTVGERERVRHELSRAGRPVPVSQANFVWIDLGADAERFAEACADAGIAVRLFAGEGVRVSIGEPEANDALLAVAGAFRGTV